MATFAAQTLEVLDGNSSPQFVAQATSSGGTGNPGAVGNPLYGAITLVDANGNYSTFTANGLKVDGSATTQPISISQTTPGTTNAVAVQSPSDVVLTLGLSNSTTAYTANQCLGGVLTLTGAVRVNGGVAVLQSVHVVDASNQKAPLTIGVFSANPSGSSITDHSTFTLATGDLPKLLGTVAVEASAYNQIGNSAADATVSAEGLVVQAAGGSQNLYAVAMTTGTPTYTTASAVSIGFGFLDS